jgi:hypothetical protein
LLVPASIAPRCSIKNLFMINHLHQHVSVVTGIPWRRALIGAVVDFWARVNAGLAGDGSLL